MLDVVIIETQTMKPTFSFRSAAWNSFALAFVIAIGDCIQAPRSHAASTSDSAKAVHADVTAILNARNQILDAWDTDLKAARTKEEGRLLTITMQNALLEMPLEIAIKRFGGQWLTGDATCRAYSKSQNPVDASGLTLSGDTLKGVMKVTLVSDGWMPPQGTTYDLTFEIDATIQDGKIAGRFKTAGTVGLERHDRIGPAGSIHFRLVKQQQYHGYLTGSAAKFDMTVTRTQAAALPSVEGDMAAQYAAVVALEQQAEQIYQHIRAVDIARMGGLAFHEAVEMIPVYPPIRPAFAEATAPATLTSVAQRMSRMRALVERRIKLGNEKPNVVIGYTATDDPDFGPYMVSGPMPSSEGKPNIMGKVDTEKEQVWAFPGNWHMIGIFKPHPRRDLLAPYLPEIVEALDATYNILIPFEKGGHVKTASTDQPPGWFAYNLAYDPITPWWGDTAAKIRRPGHPNTYFYCVTEIHSEADQTVWAGLDADDFAKLWINDTLVWASPRQEAAIGKWSVFQVNLKKGVNRVLLRSENTFGNHTVHLRFCTQGRPLTTTERVAERARIKDAYAKLDKPFIRGVNGDGTRVFPDATPVTAWDIQQNINVRWRIPLPRFSHATPVIVGDKLFTQMEPHTLICVDKMTGKEHWRRDSNIIELIADPAVRAEALAAYAKQETTDRKAARELTETLGKELRQIEDSLEKAPNPTLEKRRDQIQAEIDKANTGLNAFATYASKVEPQGRYTIEPGGFDFYVGYTMPVPVTDGKHIWVKYGTGVAACYDLDGNRKWLAQTHLHGAGPQNVASPILAGNVLVVHGSGGILAGKRGVKLTSGAGHWMVGMNATTGEVLWDYGPLRSGGYGGSTGPALVTVTNGRESMHLAVHGEGQVIRADDGKLLLNHVGARQGGHVPLVIGNTVYLGDTAVELTMHSRDAIGARIRGKGGSVLHKDKYYWMDCNHDGFCEVTVTEAATGRRIPLPFSTTQDMGDGYPLPAATRDFAFLPATSKINVVRTGAKPLMIATSKIERFHGGIVFDEDRMYIRTVESLLCIGRTGDAGAAYEKSVWAQTLIAPFPQELKRHPMESIAPDANYKPGKDVPVVRLESGIVPQRWLFAGPLPVNREMDPLGSIGGSDKARPENGTAIEFAGGAATFQPLDPKFVTEQSIDFDGPIAKKRTTTSLYYTVLECPNIGVYKLTCDKPGIAILLNGVKLNPGDHVELQPGLYALLAIVDAGGKFPPMIPFKSRIALESANDPNMMYRHHIGFIRDNADILREIQQISPGSFEATRATALLKTIE